MTFNKLHLGKYTVTRGHFITIEIFFWGGGWQRSAEGKDKGTGSSCLLPPLWRHSWSRWKCTERMSEPNWR